MTSTGDHTHERTPVWLDRTRPAHPRLVGPQTYDVAVVGGGLTGLLTGLLMARSGARVAILEGRRIASGTTGHTTAKVSLLQGTRLSRILQGQPPSVMRDYVEANREGQAWLRRFCVDHGVAVQDRPAYTYATTRVGELRARAELHAAELAGLDVTWETETELPFPVRGAVRLADQFQVHAGEVVDALVEAFAAEGGDVYEQSRVTDVRRTKDGAQVLTDNGNVLAGTVVLATSQPILRKHGFFARLKASRSYAAALRSPWTPHGMYLSSDAVTRSLRSLPVAGEDELLLVGGNGHPTGRKSSPKRQLDDLLDWARSTFPGSTVTHTWSAQDQTPVHGLPYVGPMLPRDRRVWVATGFDKWGFSNAPAAALLLTKEIIEESSGEGEFPSWGRALRSWTPREVAGAPRTALYNAEVGVHLAGGYARAALRRGDDVPEEGAGEVRYDGLRPVARSTVDGVSREVSAVCTHLGGAVAWNDAERSWDCPLHGSRFDADGSVLEGPAVCGLRRLRRDDARGGLT